MTCRSKYLVFLLAVPFRKIWRRPLMVRQPYSAAVLSTGGRLHPLPFLKGRGLGCGLRTLPLGRDRWGKYSTKGGYILPSEEEGLVRGGAPFG